MTNLLPMGGQPLLLRRVLVTAAALAKAAAKAAAAPLCSSKLLSIAGIFALLDGICIVDPYEYVVAADISILKNK